MSFIGKRMNADRVGCDGSIFFEEDRLVWKPHANGPSVPSIEIPYLDIQNVQVVGTIKKRIDVITNTESLTISLYRSETFVMLLNEAREAAKQKKDGKMAPISDDDMVRLKKLAELHDSGVLSDADFEDQKETILKRYR